MGKINRRYTKAEKLEIVKESLEAGSSLEMLSKKYHVHIGTISRWRREYGTNKEAAFPGSGKEALTADQRKIKELEKALREKELEAEILKISNGHLCITKQEKFTFMKKYKEKYTVAKMSQVLEVSRSGYYKWLKTSESSKKTEDELDKEIKSIYINSNDTYGSPRIAKELEKKNINSSKSTVARRMSSMNISARRSRKYVITTDSNHDYAIAENLLDRKFDVDEVNTVWVSDITYIRVNQGWMYLTTMIDLADRMVVGWSLSEDMTADKTVCATFRAAVVARSISKQSNIMVHSDRGVQYASKEFRELILSYGCVQSMSRKGNCWDNAPAESFFKTIKVESLDSYIFKSKQQLYTVLFRYINGWYNTLRIHSTLGNISPAEAYYQKSSKLVNV